MSVVKSLVHSAARAVGFAVMRLSTYEKLCAHAENPFLNPEEQKSGCKGRVGQGLVAEPDANTNNFLRVDDGSEYRVLVRPGEETALVPKSTLNTLLRESLLLRRKAAEVAELRDKLSGTAAHSRTQTADVPATPLEDADDPYYKPVHDFDGLRTDPKVIHNHDFMRDPMFVTAYKRALKATGVDQHYYWRVHVALWCAAHALHLDGDFVECGVWRGMLSTAIMDYFKWNDRNRNFFLFDTFRGIDESQLSDGEILNGNIAHFRHVYQEDIYESVKENFSEYRNVTIVQGSVPDTLKSVEIDKVGYLSIDMNNAAPEIAAADHFYDKLVPGAVILLDDYGFVTYEAQKHAWDNWSKKHSMPILALPTGQGLLIKPLS